MAGLIAAAVVGCGGGSDGATGATGATGAAGATGPTGATGPAGVYTVNAASLNATQWAGLSLQGAVTSVVINSPPVVTFTITDASGNPVSGLAQKDANGAYPNFGFALAKLIPANAVTKAPSRWVSYMVVTPPAEGATVKPGFPEVENNGTLVDNGGGKYTYTFALDVTKVKGYVDAVVDDVTHVKADLDDLTYDATLPHRLLVTVGGKQIGATTDVKGSANISFDFIPLTGTKVSVADPKRDIVDTASCNSCHSKLSFHAAYFPAIQDAKLCVVCHTEQQKYGYQESRDGTNAALLTQNVYGMGVTMKLDGRALPNFPNMVHKIHMGADLKLTGYNQFNVLYNTLDYSQDQRNCTKCHTGTASTTGGNTNVTANGDNWYTAPSRLACGSCHDGINFATGAGKTLSGLTTGHVGGAQADDSLCVTCHRAGFSDVAIAHRTNFATPNNPVTKAGLVNFSYDLKSVTLNSSKQPVIVFRINKDGTPVTSFATPNLVTNAVSGQQVVDPGYEPITGFAGGPTLYVAFAVPQDGVTAPADFNVTTSVGLANLLIPSGSPKAGSLAGPDDAGYFTATLTGDTVGQPAASGCVAPTKPAKATCVNTTLLPTPIVIPSNAVMVTGAIYGAFTQKGLTDYPYVAAVVTANPNTSASGGLSRVGIFKQLVATGYTGRRVITDFAKCASCHEQLGTSPSFHSGQRNDPAACAFCHNPNRTSSGWSADASTFVHGIHAAAKRSQPFTWDSMQGKGYPGVLKDCSQCHLPNTVNFGSNGETLQSKLLSSTVGTGKYVGTVGTNNLTTYSYNATTDTCDAKTASQTSAGISTLSPYVSAGTSTATATSYGVGFIASYGQTAYSCDAAGTKITVDPASSPRSADPSTLVNSPISSACFACHDTTSAKGHMLSNGGAIYEARSTALTKIEGCLACHGAGKVYDAEAIHK